MSGKNWVKIGYLSKNIRNDLMELKKLSKKEKLRMKDTEPLTRSLTQINKFRNNVENIMLSRNEGDLNTFYGRDNQ